MRFFHGYRRRGPWHLYVVVVIVFTNVAPAVVDERRVEVTGLRGRAPSLVKRPQGRVSTVSGRARFGFGSDGDVSLLPVVSLQVKSERWLGALLRRLLRLGLSASAIGLLSVSVDFSSSRAACSLDALV